jgi:hypothetical protein
MKYIVPFLFFCILEANSCTVKQLQFETILSVNDSATRSGQVDSAVIVLKKRLLLAGYSGVTITANENKQLVIHSPALDKEWIKSYLLKKGALVFYECYSLYELGPVLENADDASAGAANKKDTEKKLSYTEFLEIAPPYMTASGERMLPAYIGFVLQENILPLKKYFTTIKELLPYDAKILLKETEPNRFKQKMYEVYMVKDNDRKFFAGNYIKKSVADYEGKRPAIHIGFDAYGIHAWTRMTTANVNKAIAIVIDDNVLTAPVVIAPITGGETEISGAFDKKEIQEVANLIRSGCLSLQLSFTSMQQLKSTE